MAQHIVTMIPGEGASPEFCEAVRMVNDASASTLNGGMKKSDSIVLKNTAHSFAADERSVHGTES